MIDDVVFGSSIAGHSWPCALPRRGPVHPRAPLVLPPQDALQPPDDVLVEPDAIQAPVPPPQGRLPLPIQYAGLDHALVRGARPALLVPSHEPLAVGPLLLRHDHLRAPEEVAVARPVPLKADEVVFKFPAVQPHLAEELAHDGPVLLPGVRVVVLVVRPRAREGDVSSPALHLRHGVVDELRPVVRVLRGHGEREAALEPLQRRDGRVHPAVPGRRYLRPLGMPVRLRERPEEVVAHVSAAVRDRVDLRVPGRHAAGHHLLPRPALDAVHQRPVPPGSPVGPRGGEGLGAGKSPEGPVERRRTQLRADLPLPRSDERDALLVLADDAGQSGDEVRRARASDRLPQGARGAQYVVPVGPAPAPPCARGT